MNACAPVSSTGVSEKEDSGKQLALDYISKVAPSWWGWRPELALSSQTQRDNREKTARIQTFLIANQNPTMLAPS